MIQSSWIRQVLLLFLQFCSGFVLPCLPAVHVICQKNESHGVKTRHKDADWKWFERIVGADLGNIFLTIYYPMGRQPTQVTYGWANWRDQSLWWSELSKSVDPHFGNWLRDHVGTPGRCSQHEHGIVKDNQFTEAYKLQLSKEVQDIPCELQVGFTESDHWRTPLHRMARTLPHLRTQRGQARCLLQKSHWWRVACDLIGKRFPIVTVMIGVLEIGNDNLN